MTAHTNVYILYCQTQKAERIVKTLAKHNINAYIPKMEKYINSIHKLVDDAVMFPGYIFVESELNQVEFSQQIQSLREDRAGIIKELKMQQTTALTLEEQKLFDILFDEHWILKMSYGHKENGKTIVTKGPIISLQDWIKAVYPRSAVCTLNVYFLNRPIQAGLMITKDCQE